MSNKTKQRQYVKKQFIDAVDSLVKEHGKEAVTLRNVAEEAGYNSATLYNYFANLEDLLFHHSLGILRSYAERLEDEVYSETDALKRFVAIWRLFADESFRHPTEFYMLFFSPQTDRFNEAVIQYYEIYPELIAKTPEEVMPMMLSRNIYARDFHALEICAQYGYFSLDELHEINEFIMLLYQSVLLRVRDGFFDSPSQALGSFIKYLNIIIENYRLK